MARTKKAVVEEAIEKTAEVVKDTAEETTEELKKVAGRVKKTTGTRAKNVKKKVEEAAAEVKKTVRRKAAKTAEPEQKVYIEFAGRQIYAREILDKAVADYAAKKEGAEIQKVELYVKPEESAAYYVINGEADPEFKVEL